MPNNEEELSDLKSSARYSARELILVEKALGRYFSGETNKVCASNFGDMIERMRRMSHCSVTCPTCEGAGFDAKGSDCKTCLAHGVVSKRNSQTKPRDFVNAICFDCHGSGKTLLVPTGKKSLAKKNERELIYQLLCKQRRVVKRRGIWCIYVGMYSSVRAHATVCAAARELDIMDPPARNDIKPAMANCRSCAGRGYNTPFDVYPSPPTKSEASYEIDDRDVEAEAIVSRVYRQMTTDDPRLAAVLSVYYGPNRWSNRDGHGRIFAVFALTKPGALLIKSARLSSTDGANAHLRDDEILAEEKQRERDNSNEQRRILFRQMSDNANNLIARARLLLAVIDERNEWKLRNMSRKQAMQ